MAPLSGDWTGLQASSGQSQSGANVANGGNMGGKTNVIMFDMSKNPVYKLGEGYRTLHRWKTTKTLINCILRFEIITES